MEWMITMNHNNVIKYVYNKLFYYYYRQMEQSMNERMNDVFKVAHQFVKEYNYDIINTYSSDEDNEYMDYVIKTEQDINIFFSIEIEDDIFCYKLLMYTKDGVLLNCEFERTTLEQQDIIDVLQIALPLRLRIEW